MSCGEMCNDGRFEKIAECKKRLVEATNIETAADEMAVIDNILFRFWQMRWLDKLLEDAVPVVRCKDCKWWDQINNGPYGYCHACKHGYYSSNWEINIYRRYKEDWFCADGERRGNATD